MGKQTQSTTEVEAEVIDEVEPAVSVSIRTVVHLTDFQVLRTIQETEQLSALTRQGTGKGFKVTRPYIEGRAEKNLLGEGGSLEYYQRPEVLSNESFWEEAENTFFRVYGRKPILP